MLELQANSYQAANKGVINNDEMGSNREPMISGTAILNKRPRVSCTVREIPRKAY